MKPPSADDFPHPGRNAFLGGDLGGGSSPRHQLSSRPAESTDKSCVAAFPREVELFIAALPIPAMRRTRQIFPADDHEDPQLFTLSCTFSEDTLPFIPSMRYHMSGSAHEFPGP
jgi:hypothetical protein